jgi:hypothetical protein
MLCTPRDERQPPLPAARTPAELALRRFPDLVRAARPLELPFAAAPRAAEPPRFLELQPHERLGIVFDALFGWGAIQRRQAALIVLEHTAAGAEGPAAASVHEAAELAIDAAERAGLLDCPDEGCVRAVLPEPELYGADEWRLCLLRALESSPARADAAFQAAVGWAAEVLGLQAAGLHPGDAVWQALERALAAALLSGELRRDAAGRLQRV